MNNNTKRIFIIGDEWLYLKLYTGVKTADYILTTHFKNLLDQMIRNEYIDHWFFIRYSDPYLSNSLL